jgi:hypothetical protein
MALFRLRASMKEFLGELPPETERLFNELRQRDPAAKPRIFVPTRPTMLRQGEPIRVMVVAPGGEAVRQVVMHTRTRRTEPWNTSPMKLVGRRTFECVISGPEKDTNYLDYYADAQFQVLGRAVSSTAPLEAPERFYTISVVGIPERYFGTNETKP